jgi:hypothetical protein
LFFLYSFITINLLYVLWWWVIVVVIIIINLMAN